MWPELECRPGQAVRSLQVVLGTNLGVVAGRVVSADGGPAGGAWVRLERPDDETFFCVPAQTDRSGSFLFHSMAAGPYTLGVARSGRKPIAEGSRREVTVEPGQAVHLDLVLPEG
jgi:hypothetical protein